MSEEFEPPFVLPEAFHSIYYTDELTIQIIYYSGWLQCQCHWLQDDLSAQAGRH